AAPRQAGVFGFIDDAHAAHTELPDDAVVRQNCPDHGLDVRRAIFVKGRILQLFESIPGSVITSKGRLRAPGETVPQGHQLEIRYDFHRAPTDDEGTRASAT